MLMDFNLEVYILFTSRERIETVLLLTGNARFA